jgi:hypothetical protein
MNICLEYLSRNGIIEQLIGLPTSLFLVGENDKKLILTIQKYGENYLVKHWKVYETTKEDVLPPSNKFICSKLFSDKTILSGYNFEKPSGSIPSLENSSEPMPDWMYKLMWNNVYCYNKEDKETWLWEVFSEIYCAQVKTAIIKINKTFRFPKFNESKEEKDIIAKFVPKIWKKWLNWRKKFIQKQDLFNNKLDSWLTAEIGFLACY